MYQQGIENVGMIGADNSFDLNDRTIIICSEPVDKFMKPGFFPVVAVIADIYHLIFLFSEKCFEYGCNGIGYSLIGPYFGKAFRNGF